MLPCSSAAGGHPSSDVRDSQWSHDSGPVDGRAAVVALQFRPDCVDMTTMRCSAPPSMPRRRARLALPTLALALLMAFLVPAQAGAAGGDAADYVSRINSLRASVGVGPLQVDGELDRRRPGLGRPHGRHPDPGPRTQHRRRTEPELDEARRERRGRTRATSVIWPAFVASAHHYENIVDPAFTYVGVGVAYAGGRQWTCHRFMALGGGSPAPAPKPAPTPKPAARSRPRPPDPDHDGGSGRGPAPPRPPCSRPRPPRDRPRPPIRPGWPRSCPPCGTSRADRPPSRPRTRARCDGSGGSGPHWAHGQRHRDPRAEPQLRQRPCARRPQPDRRAR